MQNSKSIGNKIASARKKANLSQAELAQQISISPQAVGKWERGESMPDIITLNRIAEIFNVDLNYFSDYSKDTEKETISNVSAEDKGVISKLRDNIGLNWNMSGDSYVGADFSEIKNVNEKLSGSSFKNCKLIKSDLSNIEFKGNSIQDCDFTKAELRNSKFHGSEIKANMFIEASMIDVEIKASEIRNCDFTNANLSGIEISTSEFRNNNIENVTWKHASFKSTQFTQIVFSGLLEECSFSSCAFSKTSFKNATIKNSFFKYCDLKRVEFVNCQADKLTYELLKHGKADMSEIELI